MVDCSTTAHALSVLSLHQGHFASSSHQTEQTRKNLYSECATQSKVYAHNAQNVELRTRVCNEIQCTVCRCAHIVYCGRHDIIQFVVCKLLINLCELY